LIPPRKGGHCYPKAGGEGELNKIHPRVSGCSVPDVVKQKSAFEGTWFSNNL